MARAVRTARVLSVKVRGVRGVQAQGRRVNSGVNSVCVHTGTGGAGARRYAVRGVAGPGKGRPACCVPRWCSSAARGCRRTECERPWVPGARRGTASVRPCPGRALGLGRGAYSPRVPPWGRGSDSRLCLRSTAPVPASRCWLAQAPDRQPLRHPCSVAGTRLAPEPRLADRGLRGARRPNRAAPQSGHAPRSPPRAPSRPPACPPAPS